MGTFKTKSPFLFKFCAINNQFIMSGGVVVVLVKSNIVLHQDICLGPGIEIFFADIPFKTVINTLIA